MDDIYNYISKKLYSLNSAENLMLKVERIIQNLKYIPRMYSKVRNYYKMDIEYRKITINNYIILYIIAERIKTIYIIHMFYKRADYLNKI